MPLPLLAMGIPIASQAILGTWQFLSALNQAKKNKRPTYNIDPIYGQNIDILENSMGLPSAALELFYRNAGQAGAAGINAINQTGGNANQIASLVNNQQRNFLDLAVQDALQRKQDLGGVLDARLMLAEQHDKDFQINKYSPYADKAEAIAREKAAGLGNLFGAANSASGALATGATLKLSESLGGLSESLSTKISTPNSGVNVNGIADKLYRSMNRTAPMANAFTGQNSTQPTNQFTPNNYSFNNYPYNNIPQNYQSLLMYLLGQQ